MKNLLFLFCVISMAANCQDNGSGTQDKEENPCDPDIMCTMEFKIIYLEIKNAAGEPFIFDEFYITKGSDRIEAADDVYQPKSNSYPVATDELMSKLSFDGDTLSFVGVKEKKNGEEDIWVHQMVIGKDCCHIQLIDGDTEIVITE